MYIQRFFLVIACILSIKNIYSQSPNDHTREINKKLKVLSATSPEVIGGYITDNSYEGLKGGPFLFSDFIPVKLRVKEIDYYVPVAANLDLVRNLLLYKDPETGQIYSIPAERVYEIIAELENDTMVFKTTESKVFEPDIKEIKFIQVLKAAPDEFVKVSSKIFIPADYSGAYTAKRRYDEYRTENDYYIMNSGNIYKRVKLSKKSLIKVYPWKRDTIKRLFEMKTQSEEQIALSIIDND